MRSSGAMRIRLQSSWVRISRKARTTCCGARRRIRGSRAPRRRERGEAAAMMAGDFGTKREEGDGVVPKRRAGGVTRLIRRWLKPSVVVGALSLLAIVGAYWFMALRPGTNPALVPAPPRIAEAFIDELRSGDLIVNTRASLQRVVIGYVIGA